MKRTSSILWAAVFTVFSSAPAGSDTQDNKETQANRTQVQEDTSPVVAQPDVNGRQKTAKNLREKKYFYSSFGTRDPFRTLVGGDFEPKLQELVDIQTVDLVGILWEEDVRVGMVQDAQGYGYTLRPGERVRNGTIVSVTKDAVVARLNVFGQTTRVTLRLKREE